MQEYGGVFTAVACFYASIVFLYEDSQLDTRIYAKLFIFFENRVHIFILCYAQRATYSKYARLTNGNGGHRAPGSGLRAPGFSAEDSTRDLRDEEERNGNGKWKWECSFRILIETNPK